ncbi:MAG: 1-acyl-sn-glycerol-3-phosphate acyltransferase [Ilumatobacteraceae bacterium]
MKKIIARIALFLGRYKVVNRPPDEPVMLLIAAPHTSNWDFLLMLFMSWASDLSPRWLGKREMFDGVLGPIFRRLGGVSVDRRAPGSLVDDLVAEARSTSSLALVVPVEGTRDRGEYWKSGFYRIASDAEMPIVPSYLDGPTRTGGFGPTVFPSGDISADMDKFREFYADKRRVKPKNKTVPRLREEDSAIA